jgi:hypothetical protein
LKSPIPLLILDRSTERYNTAADFCENDPGAYRALLACPALLEPSCLAIKEISAWIIAHWLRS